MNAGDKHCFHRSAAVVLGLCLTLGCGEKEDDGDASGGGGSGQGGGSGGSATSGAGGSPTGGSAGSGKGGSGQGGSGASGGSGGTTGGSAGTAGTGGSGGTAGSSSGKSTAAEVAIKLGREPNFLIGMGNDLAEDHNEDGAYTLGVTLDLHYAYLVGLPGEGGWPDWNPGGYFVDILAETADDHGVTSMFTLYAMAARGEANTEILADAGFMTPYWEGVRTLFERLGELDLPSAVHVEPDFWAFAQQASGGDASSLTVRVGGIVPECSAQPDTLAGFGRCFMILARSLAPRAVVGFHASHWAGSAEDIVEFLLSAGAADTDFIAMDILDRDAGCFEVGNDPNCTRQDGPWYWDETNQESPNAHEYLANSKAIGDGLGKPILWWQVPFGVPSDSPGGSPGMYRDNRVRYIFSHIDEFIAAGGLGAAFGTGADNQTYITSDGGQFEDAVTNYYAAPVPLP